MTAAGRRVLEADTSIMELLEWRDVVIMMLERAVGHRPGLLNWGCFTGRHCWRWQCKSSGQRNIRCSAATEPVSNVKSGSEDEAYHMSLRQELGNWVQREV